MTIPRTSIFNLDSKHPFKMKAKIGPQFFWFPPTILLLGLFDYRFKHLTMMEEEYYSQNITVCTIALGQLYNLEESESRSTPFQDGEDDEDIPTAHATLSMNHSSSNIKTYKSCATDTKSRQETTRAGEFIHN